MTETVGRITVDLLAVDRRPIGQAFGASEGHVNGWPFEVTLTASEMHFAFTDRDGPAFTVNLNDLARATMLAIETVLGTGRPPR